MACKQINIRVRNCVIEVFDVCNGGSAITYFSSVASATDKKIILNKQSGGIEQFSVSDISLPSLGSGTEIAELLNQKLQECKNEFIDDKKLEEIITAYHKDEPKIPVKLFVFSNPPCVTTDIEGTNVVDINDYDMANTPGYGRELPKNSSPLVPFSLCGPVSGTLADLLPELAADPDFETAVTEETPTGLTRLQIYQAPKGTTCKGTPVTAGGVTIGTRTLDDSEGWCKKKDYEDKDCDNYSEGIDLTTVLEIPAGAAILGEAIGVCIDADDNDRDVQ